MTILIILTTNKFLYYEYMNLHCKSLLFYPEQKWDLKEHRNIQDIEIEVDENMEKGLFNTAIVDLYKDLNQAMIKSNTTWRNIFHNNKWVNSTAFTDLGFSDSYREFIANLDSKYEGDPHPHKGDLWADPVSKDVHMYDGSNWNNLNAKSRYASDQEYEAWCASDPS